MDIKQTIVAGLVAIPAVLAIGVVATIVGIGFAAGYMYAKGEDVVLKLKRMIFRIIGGKHAYN